MRSSRSVRSVLMAVCVAVSMLAAVFVCPPVASAAETSQWPTALSADVVTFTVSDTVTPGQTVSIPSGKTLIVKGGGTLSGGETTLFDVQSGGRLVLDEVTISGNIVDATKGAVYVAKGGVLDLGFNDKETRTAPSITNNTSSASAAADAAATTKRNLVVEDGARVRLNAQADKAIGISRAQVVSYSADEKNYVPGVASMSVVEGGRYALQQSDVTKIEADDTSHEKITLSNDHLVLGNASAKVLFWVPDDNYCISGSTMYTASYALKTRLLSAPYGAANVKQLYGVRDASTCSNTLASGNLEKYTRAPLSNAGDLSQYDLIMIILPYGIDSTKDYYESEVQALRSYLNTGGRIYIQGENTSFAAVNARASALGVSLGAGFEIKNSPAIEVVSATILQNNSLTAGITQMNAGNASPVVPLVTAENPEPKYDKLFTSKAKDNTSQVWAVDQEAGTTSPKKWGRLTVLGDSNFWESTAAGFINKSVGDTFLKNLVSDSGQNRVKAATGVNPNETFVAQASITPDGDAEADTVEYRSVAAGLEKVKSQSAYTTVKLAADNGLTAASDELLFSQSTIEQADGGTVTATQNDDTFVDVTSTGTVNLRSGEATVSAAAKFTVGGAGVNANDDTKVDGGYAVSSSAEYTVKAADNSSPFNGKASLKASAAGQTFKVTEPDGKTVSYKATNAGDVFYLGRYSTDYSGVSEGALVTKPESGDPWQGSEYSVTFTPNVGYGNLSVKAVDKNGKETDLTLTSATSSKARAAAQATVSEDANAGTMTVTVSNVQSNLKFAVGKFAHYATVTYKPNGADGDGADAVRTVDGGDETEFTGTLVNPFTKDDWTLMGWSEVQDGTSGVFHNASGTVSLKDGGNLDVYAVWHKANEASGSITLPGKDGKPDTGSDDVTIKQGTGADDTKPVVKAGDKEGYVEAPTNSTITRAGNSAITVNKGPVKVYPNGKIVVPEGSKITLSDGSVAEGLVTIDPDGKSDKPVRNNDGSIVLPGADKQTGDDDDVTVTPNKNGSADSSTIDKNGNVTLPDGGKVTYPAAADGNAQVVTVPKSTTVSSDGSLTIPEGKTGTLSLGGTVVPGGSSINAAGEVTYRFTIKYVDEEANSAEAAIATTALVAAKGGDELVQTEHMMVPEAELPKTLEAIEIEDYKPNQATQQLETGTDASAYTVSFSYVSVSAAREVLQEEAKQIESYIDAQQHLSAEQKAALKADLVKTTLDGSVSNTNKATTGGDVTQAKADGVEALEQLKQQIELAEQRAASSQDLSGYASNKADAIAGLDGLSQEEIASYKARIDSEVAGGDASISKAEQADIDPANQSARVQIDKIVAEAKAQAEANIRSSAEADLDAKAEQAKKQVDALQEIDQAAKDKAKAEIEQACDLAKAKIDQASDTQQVQTEQQAGVKTIDEIVSGVVAENTAVLDEAKSDAIKELKAKASEVDKLIDAKQYLSEAQQRELHERVASTLEEYIAKVNAAESAEGVGEAKLAGLEALEAISADATRLDEEAAASRAKASSTSAKTATAGHAVDVDTLSNTGSAVESLALLVVFSVLLGASLTLLRRHA